MGTRVIEVDEKDFPALVYILNSTSYDVTVAATEDEEQLNYKVRRRHKSDSEMENRRVAGLINLAARGLADPPAESEGFGVISAADFNKRENFG